MLTHVTDFYQNKKHAEHYLNRRLKNLVGQFRHERQVALINDVIAQNNFKTALEIACGPARLTSEIKGIQKGVAIDASQAMLELARQRVNRSVWKFCVADAFVLPFVQQFDLIFTGRFIWHFPLTQRKKIYQLVQTHLAPDGCFLFDALTNNRFLLAKQQTKMYEERYQELGFLASELSEAGFKVEAAEGYLFHPNIQHLLAKVGDLMTLKQPIWLWLNLIEQLKSKHPEEYLIVCQKK